MDTRLTRLEGKVEAVDGRLGRVETRLDKVDDRLRGVETGIATLAERVAHLPSKGFIVTATTISLGLLSAVILFADKIRALIGG